MFRIGCVPYLNAKPLIDWFHSPDCDVEAEIHYVVPSRLAEMLRNNELDVALVSIFEAFQNRSLKLVPNISISATGPVKSVRLFSKTPFAELKSIAMDTSSLTSVAMTRILLSEMYGIEPATEPHAPHLDEMLERCDAGLIIGDLRLFETTAHYVMDMGEAWQQHTGLPFVYAAWLATESANLHALCDALTRSKKWGIARLDAIATKWAAILELPLDRVHDYLTNVMEYNLTERHREGLSRFQNACFEHGLTGELFPLQ